MPPYVNCIEQYSKQYYENEREGTREYGDIMQKADIPLTNISNVYFCTLEKQDLQPPQGM